MKNERKEFLLDLAVYIQYAVKRRHGLDEILFNIYHDIHGISENREYFLPRVHGFRKRIKAGKRKRR